MPSRPCSQSSSTTSRVVLRKFQESVGRAGNQLARVDVVSGAVDGLGPNGLGYVEHFIPVDSEATEKLWQTVEGRVNPAIAGALSGDAASLETLKNLVVLHYVRNPQIALAHKKAFEDAAEQGVDRWAKTPLAAESFRRKTGLFAAGEEALRIGAEESRSQGRMRTLYADGGLFRLSAQRLYETVRDRVAALNVELLSPAGSSEFLSKQSGLQRHQ